MQSSRTYYQRGRFISRKIAIDPKLNSQDDSHFLLYLMMVPHLDAEARMLGDAVIIKGVCCPKRKWSAEKVEEMLVRLQTIKRDDGLGILERYEAKGIHCLWMAGFEGEQKGLQKDHEAKGKYGYSDIPPPPKVILRKFGVEPVTDDNSFIDELRPKYPNLDLDKEWDKCKKWWKKEGRKMKDPKRAFINWLSRARGSKQPEPVETGDKLDGFKG